MRKINMLKTKWYMDMRERDLNEKLQSLSFSFESKALDVGDMQIIDIESNEILYVFERKTLSDLSSSITDGRYKEQKQRLLHALSPKIKKIYVIEGDQMKDFHLDKSVFEGVMINTVIRDGIMIYRTRDLDETVHMIQHIGKNVEDHYEEIMKNYVGIVDTDYQVFKTVKKENMTEKVVFRAMLTMIPQISNTIADVLVEEFGNMEKMISQIREDTEDDSWQMVKKISEMKYGSSKRRIGEVTAMKIVMNLFDIDDETKSEWMGKTKNKKKVGTPRPRMKKKESEVSSFLAPQVRKDAPASLVSSLFSEE